MSKIYYEIVFEGQRKAIRGLLEGFRLSLQKTWHYYFNSIHGIESKTLKETLKGWITLHTNLHHVVMEKDFYDELKNKLSIIKDEDNFIHEKYIKSAKEITNGKFSFTAETYGKKYGEEIKSILKDIPEGLTITGYKPEEHIEKDEEDEGIDLYAPDHDYEFKATGEISGSDINLLLTFRKKLDDHPLIEVDDVVLSF